MQLAQFKNGSFELVILGMMLLEQGSIFEGAIKDLGQVAEALANLVKAEKNQSNFLVAFVSWEAVFVQKIKVSEMSEEELSTKINEEAEQYIPFDINYLALDYQVLSRVNGHASQSERTRKEIFWWRK